MKGIYYGWVCEQDFQRGQFAETTIPGNLLQKPCIVCGERVGAHQVEAAAVARIFEILRETMTYYIVGASLGEKNTWEFVGVFATAEGALKACATRAHFMAPTELDVAHAGPAEDWPGLRWPLAEWENG